ncbi:MULTISPECIES: hypothetical protein [unclassified Microcoleus]|uniref:hypothetical protein n=1 Tax=unclassified Microcoleus TaxID=2642155 RepID=UPI002FD32B69
MSLQLMGRDTALPCPRYHSDATGNDITSNLQLLTEAVPITELLEAGADIATAPDG